MTKLGQLSDQRQTEEETAAGDTPEETTAKDPETEQVSHRIFLEH